MEGMRSHVGAARQEREKLKAEISNLASVIADGRQSPALLAELEKRERRLDKISEELLESNAKMRTMTTYSYRGALFIMRLQQFAPGRSRRT